MIILIILSHLLCIIAASNPNPTNDNITLGNRHILFNTLPNLPNTIPDLLRVTINAIKNKRLPDNYDMITGIIENTIHNTDYEFISQQLLHQMNKLEKDLKERTLSARIDDSLDENAISRRYPTDTTISTITKETALLEQEIIKHTLLANELSIYLIEKQRNKTEIDKEEI
ncbi:hypothetical protein NEOKW01_0884, partial [Nematocida sp. AWRm80]